MNAGRYRLGLGAADRVATLEAEAPGHVDIAEQTLAHLLDGLNGSGIRPRVHTALYDLVVLPRRRYNLLRFEDIVRDRLLAVDVLPGLQRPDRLQRMVVVRRSDRDAIDVFLFFEKLPDVDVPG